MDDPWLSMKAFSFTGSSDVIQRQTENWQGSKSTGRVYSAVQSLLQHVELQGADDADDGRRTIVGE